MLGVDGFRHAQAYGAGLRLANEADTLWNVFGALAAKYSFMAGVHAPAEA